MVTHWRMVSSSVTALLSAMESSSAMPWLSRSLPSSAAISQPLYPCPSTPASIASITKPPYQPTTRRSTKMLELRNDKPIASLAPQVAQAIQPLRGEHEAEVLDFLSAHPLLTFVMTGWIKDNGLVSELNRGTFYASRNGRGELDGVALIGHVTLVETNSGASMSRFAELTRNCPSSFVVMGEERRID